MTTERRKNTPQGDMINDALEARLSELEKRATIADEAIEQRDKAFTLLRKAKRTIDDLEAQTVELHAYLLDVEKQLAEQAQYVESDVREKMQRTIDNLKRHMVNPDAVAKLARMDEFVLGLLESIEKLPNIQFNYELLKEEYSRL